MKQDNNFYNRLFAAIKKHGSCIPMLIRPGETYPRRRETISFFLLGKDSFACFSIVPEGDTDKIRGQFKINEFPRDYILTPGSGPFTEENLNKIAEEYINLVNKE